MSMDRQNPGEGLAPSGSLRSELPWLALQMAFLVVLLHANSPEVWFWFAALLVLLIWRTMAWQNRRWQRLQASAQEPPSTSGSSTGSPG
jgi:Flp pilus assembly protein TadB